MVLDVLLFRKEAGGDPALLKESQRRRFKDPALVDTVVDLDVKLRAAIVKSETLTKVTGYCNKAYGERKKKKLPDGDDAPIPDEIRAKAVEDLTRDDLSVLNGAQLLSFVKEIKLTAEEEVKIREKIEGERDAAVRLVGNVVHESCVFSDDEVNNPVIREWGTVPETTEDTWNHVDLMEALGGMDTTDAATQCSGSRAYFLKGDLVQLQLALVNYAMSYLVRKEYTPMYPPFFMRKQMMAHVAELAQFDEELYHVSGDGDDKYLIATSEQPICAYHANKRFDEKDVCILFCVVFRLLVCLFVTSHHHLLFRPCTA